MPTKPSLVLLAAMMLRAQQPAAVFEVASIKPSSAADFRRTGMKFLPGGRFVATNYPLQVLIAGAYQIPYQSSRLTGGPEWVRSDRYDIDAKAEAGAIPNALPAAAKRERMRQMLQDILADRFHLTLRRETREMPVYDLAIARNGLKLAKAAIDEEGCLSDAAGEAVPCHVLLGGQGHGIHGRAVELSDLAVFLENFTDRPVVLTAGLPGLYQIDTKAWLPLRQKSFLPGEKAEDGSELSSLPSLFTMLRELGLTLQPGTAQVKAFVIQHVERPSVN
jgi:uncharacterized protein (TIGR03435 family)